MWGPLYFEITSANNYHYFFKCYFLLFLSRCSSLHLVPASFRWLQLISTSFRRFQHVPACSLFSYVRIFYHMNWKLSLFDKVAITSNSSISSKPLLQIPHSQHSMHRTLLSLLRMPYFVEKGSTQVIMLQFLLPSSDAKIVLYHVIDQRS